SSSVRHHAHALTSICCLSLHDALPIFPVRCGSCNRCEKRGHTRRRQNSCFSIATQSLATMWCPLSGSSEASRCVPRIAARGRTRSEEHTSASHQIISYAVFCLKKKKK